MKDNSLSNETTRNIKVRNVHIKFEKYNMNTTIVKLKLTLRMVVHEYEVMKTDYTNLLSSSSFD